MDKVSWIHGYKTGIENGVNIGIRSAMLPEI